MTTFWHQPPRSVSGGQNNVFPFILYSTQVNILIIQNHLNAIMQKKKTCISNAFPWFKGLGHNKVYELSRSRLSQLISHTISSCNKKLHPIIWLFQGMSQPWAFTHTVSYVWNAQLQTHLVYFHCCPKIHLKYFFPGIAFLDPQSNLNPSLL